MVEAEVDGVRFFEGELTIAKSGEFSGVEVDDADALVEGVGDEETTVGVEGEVVHAIETSFGGGAVVSGGDVA